MQNRFEKCFCGKYVSFKSYQIQFQINILTCISRLFFMSITYHTHKFRPIRIIQSLIQVKQLNEIFKMSNRELRKYMSLPLLTLYLRSELSLTMIYTCSYRHYNELEAICTLTYANPLPYHTPVIRYFLTSSHINLSTQNSAQKQWDCCPVLFFQLLHIVWKRSVVG